MKAKSTKHSQAASEHFSYFSDQEDDAPPQPKYTPAPLQFNMTTYGRERETTKSTFSNLCLPKGAMTKAERSTTSSVGRGYSAHGTSTRYLGGSATSKFTIQKQHNLSKISEDEEEENLILGRLQAQQHRGA